MNRPTENPQEETDALLRAFFRSEMPAPWPALSRTKPPAAWPAGAASRMALAASIAVLLAAGYLVADRLAGPGVPSFHLGDGKAAKEPMPPMAP